MEEAPDDEHPEPMADEPQGPADPHERPQQPYELPPHHPSHDPHPPYEAPETPSPPLVSDMLPATVACPICEEQVPLQSFMAHLAFVHPVFYMTIETFLPAPDPDIASASLLNPSFQHSIATLRSLTWDPLDPQDSEPEAEDDGLTYEYLMELCETIGNHEVGVEDVDAVAPLDTYDFAFDPAEGAEAPTRCAICLDSFQDMPRDTPTRTIAVCGHRYCAGCIEQWFTRKRVCPLCKKNVEDVEDVTPAHMASMSRSRSPVLDPLASESESSEPSSPRRDRSRAPSPPDPSSASSTNSMY